MNKLWITAAVSVLIFVSCGAETTKPPTKSPESVAKIEKNQSNTTTNNNFKFITMTGSEKECCLDLKANKISKLTINLDTNSNIETINIQVLYEDMMLIGEKNISIPKNRLDRIIELEDVKITMPESAVDGQMIVIYARSDKETRAKLEYGLQDQSPKETDIRSDEQKRADLVSMHQAETGIKKVLINEKNRLAFIDGSNNLFFYEIEEVYNDKYELNTQINIGDCETVCTRNINNLPQYDNYRGFCLFFKADNQLKYVLCRRKQVEGFIEEQKLQEVTEPVISGIRKIYVASDGRTFFSIDSNNEISCVFYKEDYTDCYYSKEFPDSFFASFGGPDRSLTNSGYGRFSFIDGSTQKGTSDKLKEAIGF